MDKIKIAKVLLPISLTMLLTGFTHPTFKSGEVNKVDSIEVEEIDEVTYSMYINDSNIGAVKFAAHGLSMYDKVLDRIKDNYPDSVSYEGEVYFKQTSNSDILKDDELGQAIEDAIQVKMPAYGVIIEDEPICFLQTDDEIDQVLDRIKVPYRNDIEQREGAEFESIEIKENIDIKKEIILYKDIVDIDRAFEIITQGADSHKAYVVEEGESLWSIANKNEITVSQLEAANPDIEGDIIQPGQELKLVEQKNSITVVTKEKVKELEEIEFEKEIQKSNQLYKDESKVTQEGVNGEKEIEYLITRENGSQSEKEKIEETVLKEPIKEITQEGTKSRPVAKPKPTKKSSSSSSRGTGSSSTSTPKDYTPIVRNGVEMTPWFGGAENIFTRGSTAKVTHVDTGLTFYVKRRGGSKHADSEPLTSNDTAIMKKVYGGSWSWSRKAIIVEAGGKKMAASMNGMPHGGASIGNNGFSGHFCIHFYNSKGHASNKVDSDHQAAIKRAMGM